MIKNQTVIFLNLTIDSCLDTPSIFNYSKYYMLI